MSQLQSRPPLGSVMESLGWLVREDFDQPIRRAERRSLQKVATNLVEERLGGCEPANLFTGELERADRTRR